MFQFTLKYAVTLSLSMRQVYSRSPSPLVMSTRAGKLSKHFLHPETNFWQTAIFNIYNTIIEYEPPRIGIGYRWFDYNNFTPLWPFGHELSYTIYGYADLSARHIQDSRPDAVVEVTATITNTGDRAGD